MTRLDGKAVLEGRAHRGGRGRLHRLSRRAPDPDARRNAPLLLPTPAMAEAVAAEWAAVAEVVDPGAMPVTRSANAAIDKVALQFDEVANLIAAYGGTDLLCYRAAGPEALVRAQSEGWDPLLDWAARSYGAPLVTDRRRRARRPAAREPRAARRASPRGLGVRADRAPRSRQPDRLARPRLRRDQRRVRAGGDLAPVANR